MLGLGSGWGISKVVVRVRVRVRGAVRVRGISKEKVTSVKSQRVSKLRRFRVSDNFEGGLGGWGILNIFNRKLPYFYHRIK